jgi:2-keto-3-deoxy-L-rhamnonate aldolase RhmA
MAKATFQELARGRGLHVGVFLGEFATPGIGQILAGAGCEFAFVDMEHTGFGYETVKQVLRGLHDAGLASVVRPPSQHYHDIARALDVGAEGVIPPMLSNPEQAEALVRSIKYPPDGMRGVALGMAHDDYRAGALANKFAAANAKTSGVALIETKEAIESIDTIAATPGIDCLWVGHFDLSCSLGIPGRFDHPDFQAANEKVVQAGKRHGKSLGRLVASMDDARTHIAMGFNILAYSTDIALLQGALAEGVRGIRSIAS